MRKIKGLRRRWLINTAGSICAVGLICVVLITAVFTVGCYSSMESDMRLRAETTGAFLTETAAQSYEQCYQSCITYVKTFGNHNHTQLQFIHKNGEIIASSGGAGVGQILAADDFLDAISRADIAKAVGKDPLTGKRAMAISSPILLENGEVVGVLRYVTPTLQLYKKVILVACVALSVLALMVVTALFNGSYYVRFLLDALSQITEKAKMVANGSYGIQIQAQYDDEIGELAQTINDMSMQINRNEMTQTEFISSLSHELRTPLTAITGWSETLLSSDDLDENTRRGVKIILGEGKRLTEMVLELLDFTRIQDGRMTLNMELTDIRAEFEDTVFMYGSRLAQEGIRLEYLENDEEIPVISCDPKRLRQVFLNILDNAAKHGGEGKRIDADITANDSYVTIRIRDYGPGIPEDELSLVKRKFYKGSSKARGSGIGLAVCDEIVQMHGGELTLENAQGGGTLVTIELPASQ